eukprot:5745056-Pleurochrysis_carterae.AAC.1
MVSFIHRANKQKAHRKAQVTDHGLPFEVATKHHRSPMALLLSNMVFWRRKACDSTLLFYTSELYMSAISSMTLSGLRIELVPDESSELQPACVNRRWASF